MTRINLDDELPGFLQGPPGAPRDTQTQKMIETTSPDQEGPGRVRDRQPFDKDALNMFRRMARDAIFSSRVPCSPTLPVEAIRAAIEALDFYTAPEQQILENDLRRQIRDILWQSGIYRSANTPDKELLADIRFIARSWTMMRSFLDQAKYALEKVAKMPTISKIFAWSVWAKATSAWLDILSWEEGKIVRLP